MKLSEMFNNYPQPDDYIPDNHPKCCKPMCLDIMVGETTIHTFEIPFNIETETLGVEVMYKLGVNLMLVKTNEDLTITIDEEKNTSIISCEITSQESLLFRNTVLDTNVQIKFIMLDKTIKMSEIYTVKVCDSLDSQGQPPVPPVPPPPGPGTIGGIGYTED